jgi:hypothetical protein
MVYGMTGRPSWWASEKISMVRSGMWGDCVDASALADKYRHAANHRVPRHVTTLGDGSAHDGVWRRRRMCSTFYETFKLIADSGTYCRWHLQGCTG